MSIPIIFTFNIRRSVYQAFGTSHFNQIKLLYKNIHLLPIINNLDEGIQSRGQKIKQKLPLLLNKLKSSHAHLISYSVSGLDARYALSGLGLAEKCMSLTTISTPHKGSKTAALSERGFFKKVHIQPIARLLGIGIKPFHQTVEENVRCFNEEIHDADNVKYFSIGSQRLPNNCHQSLKQICNYLRLNTKKNFTYQNDGVFGYDQIQWGQHLANFDADHSEIAGVTSSLNQIQSIQLAIENIRNLQKVQITGN